MSFINTAYRTVIKIKIHSLVYYKNSEKCYKEMKKLQEFEVRKQEQAQAMQEQAAASLAQYESKKKEQKETKKKHTTGIAIGAAAVVIFALLVV